MSIQEEQLRKSTIRFLIKGTYEIICLGEQYGETYYAVLTNFHNDITLLVGGFVLGYPIGFFQNEQPYFRTSDTEEEVRCALSKAINTL